MSAASNPPQPFVFVEGFEPAHYERTVRSYLSRKVWREKRVEQIRKYQKLSPPLPLTSVHSHLPFTKSSGKPAEAQAMMFPGAKLLPGWHRVFLGIGQMLLGKTPPFLGTPKQFLGISIAPRTSSLWYVLGSWPSPTLKARLAQPGLT
jgi:hypothetical protein